MRLATAFAVIACMVACAASASAQSLSVQPQRIILDARVGNSALSLTNTSERAGSFRVEFVDYIYQDDGKVVPTDKVPAGYPSAKGLVRFSPSQVQLAPGETQTVRILFKRQAGLADGEYRVHAVLRRLPDISRVKNTATESTVVSGVIGIEQSIAVPVIVRQGQTAATGSIAAVKVSGGKQAHLDVQLARSGTRSLYTNLVIKDGAGAVLQEVKGIAVPVPNRVRRIDLMIKPELAGVLSSGGHTLELVDHDSGSVIDRKPIK